jgi:hypothetical protein
MLKTRSSHSGAAEVAGFPGHENLRGAIAQKNGALLSVTSYYVAPSVFIRWLYFRLHIKVDEVTG